eukprot:scaffold83724_cov17-Tisochrysis_lutea.AAC.1
MGFAVLLLKFLYAYFISSSGTLQTEDGSDELALKKLFMRIDANSDETIDWDEFSNFMLMESQGGASIKEVEMSINFEQPGMHTRGERQNMGKGVLRSVH